MINTRNIGSFIYDTMINDEILTKTLKVGDNIFPIVAEEGTNYPFIIYKRTGLVSNGCKDGYYEDTTRVEIRTVCSTYEQSINIINRIRELFERQHFVYNGMEINDVTIEGASENYEYNAFTQLLNLNLKIND